MSWLTGYIVIPHWLHTVMPHWLHTVMAHLLYCHASLVTLCHASLVNHVMPQCLHYVMSYKLHNVMPQWLHCHASLVTLCHTSLVTLSSVIGYTMPHITGYTVTPHCLHHITSGLSLAMSHPNIYSRPFETVTFLTDGVTLHSNIPDWWCYLTQ